MLLEPRKHLFAMHVVLFIVIWFLRKVITIFCIIEQRACKGGAACPSDGACEGLCAAGSGDKPSSQATGKESQPASGAAPGNHSLMTIIKCTPIIRRKFVRNFGFGEGHYRRFIKEHERIHHITMK